MAIRFDNGRILGTAGAVAPVLAVLAPRGLAPLFAVAALAVLGLCFLGRSPLPAVGWRFPVLLGVALGWAAASALWALEPGLGLGLVPVLVAIFAGGLVLTGAAAELGPEARDSLGRALVLGVWAGLAVLAFEAFLDTPLLRLIQQAREVFEGETAFSIHYMAKLKNGGAVLALMAWPAALVLWRRGRRVAAVALPAICLVVVAKSDNGATTVALAAGAAGAAAALWAPRRLAAALGAVAVAAILAAPLATRALDQPRDDRSLAERLPSSYYYRLLIWDFALERIAERPVLGWGLDSSRIIPGGGEKVRILYDDPGNGQRTPAYHQVLPLHPHSAVLQWWLELGLPGVAVFFLVIAAALAALFAKCSDGPARAAGLGTILSGLVIANLSYGIWQSWWLAALWLAAAFLSGVLNAKPESERPPA